MTASRVHAVLVAGIENPKLIERWQDDPGRLLDYGIDPESIDLPALWKFAGLTVKVRHNGLRAELPMTFRLLNVAGLEIDVFASYAAFCAARDRNYAQATEERTRDLVSFLENWLDFSQTAHLLLWDLVRHERALGRLNRIAPQSSGRTDANGPEPEALTGEYVPSIRGEVILHEMRSDPGATTAELRKSQPALNETLLGDRYFCYWRTGEAAEIRILELDALGYYVLTFADGVHPISRLGEELGLGRRPTQGFLNSLNELAAVGILEFMPAATAR